MTIDPITRLGAGLEGRSGLNRTLPAPERR